MEEMISVEYHRDVGHILAINHTPLANTLPVLIGMRDYIYLGIMDLSVT